MTEAEGSGIVYVATRKAAERYAALLGRRGPDDRRRTTPGSRTTVREQAQADFMSSAVDVVVATSAFGMGIDKADVRWVRARQHPGVAGRVLPAGGPRGPRRRSPRQGVLFYRPEDLALLRFQTVAVPSPAQVTRVLGALATLPDGSPAEQAEAAGVSARKLTRIANLVVEAAAEGETVEVEDVRGRAEGYQALQRSRVDMVRGYAETRRCRRQFLLAYLGEDDSPRCERCDNCRSGIAAEEDAESASVEASPCGG